MTHRFVRLASALASILLLAACASSAPPRDERDPADPWEPFNRNVFAFNQAVDRAVFKPLAEGYTAITPDPVERSVNNVFNNLRSVRVIVNLLLQGEPGDAMRMFERFFSNTVYGLGGIFDVASAADLPDYDEDFGQTLAVWGWEDSRYLVLPIFGPSTLRDGLSRPADAYSSIAWREVVASRPYIIPVEVIQNRANLLPRDREIEQAFDPYLFIRDAWLQRREYQISGESSTPDYDSFLSEDPWADEP